MSPILVGTIVFLCTLGGALLGNWLRTLLPVEHLGEDTKDTVKVAIGLVATMTALILGLVTASAKKSFDDVDTALEHSAMDMLALDRLLARYGPETAPIRNDMHQALALRIEVMWPTGAARHDVDPLRSSMLTGVENLAGALRGLNPADENQQSLRNRALDLGETLLQTRWRIFASGGTSIPLPFLIVLVFWLTMIFASFGLFAPRNGTVFAALFVCALSVGSAVFLILELDGPFDGLIRASPEPLQYALAHLNQ